jgi:hypothetical protein
MSAADARVSCCNKWGLRHNRDECPYTSSCLLRPHPRPPRTGGFQWRRLDNLWSAFNNKPLSVMGHQPLRSTGQSSLRIHAAGLGTGITAGHRVSEHAMCSGCIVPAPVVGVCNRSCGRPYISTYFMSITAASLPSRPGWAQEYRLNTGLEH